MSAFTPPATTWCPDCARERVSCRHLDADALRADGGDDLFCDGCGTTHGVRLVRVRDPDGIITTCASCEDDLNSTIVEEIDPDHIAADGGSRRTLVSDYRTAGDEPSTTFEDAEACEECGKTNAGIRAADGRALCGACHQQATDDLVTDGGEDLPDDGFGDVTVDVDLTAEDFPDLDGMSVEELQAHYKTLLDYCYDRRLPTEDVEDIIFSRNLDTWDEIRSRFPETEEPECEHCGAKKWSGRPGDPPSCRGCGSHPTSVEQEEAIGDTWNTFLQGEPTPEAATDGGLVDDIDLDDAETPAIDRARAAHPKWLELVSAASRRDKGRVERLADELRGDLTFIERTIDDLADDEEGA